MYTHDIDLAPGYGARLAEARKMVDASLQDIADTLGYTARTINKWERELTRPRGADLSLLQEKTGIRKAWITDGQQPLLADSRDQADHLSGILAAAIGERLHDLTAIPQGSFMAPMLQERDTLLLAAPLPIVSGGLYLVNVGPNVTRVGRLHPTASGDWFLYSDEDRLQPGICPPMKVEEGDLAGRVAGFIRPLPRE